MYNYGTANERQREAIKTTNGPVLIIAGPGTGKTFTLVKRTLYLIKEKNIPPENIMIATFTEKAAKEIITRLSDELLAENKSSNVNINSMYIGTFHSICLRIINENIEHTAISKNYKILDDFDQKYLIYQNLNLFTEIDTDGRLFANRYYWDTVKEIAHLVNIISEELISVDEMAAHDNSDINRIADILQVYNELLRNENALDFSTIQATAYNLLNDNPEILCKLQDKIQYIMVDEYQDTNYIQEQIIFKLAGERKNICVVGDDDQGLYRFRGATIRNILEFPNKFEENLCRKIFLTENYRSDKQIIDFYNKWMRPEEHNCGDVFEWGKFRYPKEITATGDKHCSSPAVIKISGQNDINGWYERIADFIMLLRDSGKVTNLNQIAFLFYSVTNNEVKKLAEYLEENGIKVYSPRSDMFFERYEIELIIGLLLLTFNTQTERMFEETESQDDEYEANGDATVADTSGSDTSGVDNRRTSAINDYYMECINKAGEFIGRPENEELCGWISEHGKIHAALKENTDYGLSDLVYELFQFMPFNAYLKESLSAGNIDLRPARNLSAFTNMVTKFEFYHRVTVLTEKNIDGLILLFFGEYLKLLYKGGISEYEDDSEYAPSGCVSFLTIHQSKGMEFPVVFTGINQKRVQSDKKIKAVKLLEDNGKMRESYEPDDKIKFFDLWRRYYTAFSRAQNLLVLTCNEESGRGYSVPHKYFRGIYGQLSDSACVQSNINEYRFSNIRNVNIKSAFSFTSHVVFYENCPMQYKYFKELNFPQTRLGATIFGTLVHQTIEDIHRAILRNEAHLITEKSIENWFNINYSTISMNERAFLDEEHLNSALAQVKRYAYFQRSAENGIADRIREAEFEISLVKPDYILTGKIDLVKGTGDTVELVDFKTEKKPDERTGRGRAKLSRSKRQLQIYAYLVEEKTDFTVSKMHLYYTGEKNGSPTITFIKDNKSVDKTMIEFDSIVRKIIAKDFSERAETGNLCNECSMRFLCRGGCNIQ